MQPRYERLGLQNGEGGYRGTVFFGHSQTIQTGGRVVLLRVISIAVVEGAANHADRVVIGFLRPLVRVRDLGEFGVSDLFEYPWTDLRSPDLREEFAITPGRHEGQVFLCNPRITSNKELIKDLVARAPFLCC